GARVAAGRVRRVLQEGPRDGAYDVAVADPPYALGDGEITSVLEELRDRDWMQPGALVVVERASRGEDLAWPEGYTPDRVRRYGEAALWYGHAANRPGPR
ncbi:RsmD family RNA methyltransferase, partial [Streptomonospora algeriensis]